MAPNAAWRSCSRPGLVVAGRFELVERMGAGGFGEVWRARHKNLGIDVALKVLCTDAASHSDLAAIEERFRFEAQVSALVGKKTSHVVAVHDAGICEVGPFLAMELVVGRSLESMIDDGPLAIDALVPLLAELGEAIDASHAAGIVHRDLRSPPDVLDHPRPKMRRRWSSSSTSGSPRRPATSATSLDRRRPTRASSSERPST